MKLNELLSRYLFRRRSRRDRRQKSALQPSPVTLVDVQLETRVLLSGTSEPEPVQAEPPITVRSSEVGNTAVISVAGGSSFTITAGDLYAAATTAIYSTDDYSRIDEETSSPAFSDALDLQQPTRPANAGRTLLDFEFGTQNVIASLGDSAGDLNLRLTNANTLLQYDGNQFSIVEADHDANVGLSGAAPDIANQIGETKISPIEKARKESSTSRSQIDTGATSDNTSTAAGTERSAPTEYASPADPSSSSQQPTDLFFAAALDNPFWSLDSQEVSQTPRAHVRPANNTRDSVPIEFRERAIEANQPTASIDSLKRQAGKSSQKSSAAQTSVFTTSDSKTAFAELLNSFVQFDTTDLLEEDQKLTDWLSEQLGLSAFEEEANNLDASTVTTTFADTNEVANNEEQIERLQQSYLKIDYSSNPDATITILSEQPPVPPEIVGIWQRIRFDCNPRGPPVSDRATGFGSSSFPAGAAQLQQLRYSIAPRGPSVASVN